MQKAKAVILILLLGLPVLLTAQDGPDIEVDWDDYRYDLYSQGDQVLMISVGVIFPTLFINNGNLINHKIEPPVGGVGSLAFHYFLRSRLFIGGEVGGFFCSTLAGNTLYIIPLGFRVGTLFLAGRFEFPLIGTIGVSWHNYLDFGYFGLYFKAGGSVFFRATNHWAFGLTSSWYLFPEWTDNAKFDVYGNFLDLTLSARYHF
jgi:hypothetical protein